MKTDTKSYLKTRLILVNFVISSLLLIILEIGLRFYAPIYLTGYHLQYAPHTERYGWGYFPKQKFPVINPDTGEKSFERVNSKGWRDKERSYKNKKNAFRILILGDSETFGAIVKYEDRFASQLEKKLQKDYNAQVISLAYGGWGTDQQLEALEQDGFKFEPNLVISQFNKNDLGDNSYYFYKQNLNQCRTDLEPKFGHKPYYYILDSLCQVKRHQDPKFLSNRIKRNEKAIKEFIFKSEILKRIYYIYLNKKYNFSFSIPNFNPINPKYEATTPQLNHLATVLEHDSTNTILNTLENYRGKFIPKIKLEEIITETENEINSKKILRILEHRHFKVSWNLESYNTSPIDTSTYIWQLYFRLIEKMKTKSKSYEADLAIFSSTEFAHYHWLRSWYWINPSEEAKMNSQQHFDILRDKTGKINVDYIENTQPYPRAKNDPHINAKGNKALADDIYKYLISKKKSELEVYRHK